MPTESQTKPDLTELPELPEYARPFFELFVSCLRQAANEDNNAPIVLHPHPDDPSEMSLEWDESDPAMAFIELFSNTAISLFIQETFVLGIKRQEDYSITTQEDDE